MFSPMTSAHRLVLAGGLQVHMSSPVRLFIALLSVSTVLLVSVPAVEAATVRKTGEEPVITLTYQAAPGEQNRVAVTMTPDLEAWIVSENGFDASGALVLIAGPGCTSLGPQTALCEYNVEDSSETSRHVVIDLGDNHDFAWASGACGPTQALPCQALISGGEGADVVFANDVDESWFATDEPSRVRGGPGADRLRAGQGGSRLIGGPGADSLLGGAGKDMLVGGGGRDTIRGGFRSDELRGGARADTFYARDGYRDRVFGGKGRDSARVDRLLDRVRSIARLF
jgi:RTX calcium-binding nonapeptide repeat (4 copies)